jgi:ammonia channel protein AmtB
MNELSIFIAMSIVCILWAAMTYSVGYKEGQREGFKRGRAVSRHAAKEVR